MGEVSSAADAEIFYVDLDVNAYESSGETIPIYDINTTEFVGDSIARNSPSNCEIEHIPREEGGEIHSTETKVCILDAPEDVFFLQDLHLVFNVPEEMCHYVELGLPWHFNFAIRPGPVSIKCPVSVGEEETELYCEADYDENTLEKTCPSNASETSCYIEEDDLCPSAPGNPKCCNGGEKEDNKKWLPDAECFGGPAFAARDIAPEDFLKIHAINIPEGGLRQTISLRHLLEIDSSPESIFHANYHETLDLSFRGLSSLNRENLPPFLQASDYYEYLPRLFFQFACLDAATEIQHELLLMYREWNTLEEFMDFYNSGGRIEGDPDIEGIEGDECEYEERFSASKQCNDHKDQDDYGNNYPEFLKVENILSSGDSE